MYREILNLPGVFAFAKNRHGKYTFASEAYAEAANIDSPQQIVGLTDYDMPWRQQAPELLADDKLVWSGHPITNQIETIPLSNRIVKVTTSKAICESKQWIIGVAHEISDPQSSSFTIDKEKQVITLGPPFQNTQLNRKEVDTLSLILNGLEAVEIAKKLGLSVKGIEHRTKIIKQKLKCENKKDLPTLCLKHNLSSLVNCKIDW
ncbi:LuxR C-terminal-related transcriptional regulator [Spartinivicinus poritis]|uniref:LuxR C-terminal-related transcriptional regulator n=1 Tax=Spartinivicinus poritis TaxID=2994640 RepID=A0ABT5U5K2_9GAMM|nr:LuxR C-terminal-related transcriptional regulator [Spartinivicinus sp. A2-2]MDE1461636.1 LuxR C-terminal-related transcriptional regulator [Spartinivicinus sp. A2-2]